MKLNKDETPYRVGKDVLIKQSTIGDKSFIDNDSVVLQSTVGRFCDIEKRNLIRKASVGDMTYTGADTSIMWATVGKYCCISRMVDIGGNEHDYQAASMMPSYRLTNKLAGTLKMHPNEDLIHVGNDVWIGAGAAIIRKEELTVGDGVVIGAGAVVTKDVPPYAIVAGGPARVIRFRFPQEIIDGLLELKWWDWEDEKIVEAWPLLSAKLDEDTLKKLMQ